MRRALLGLAFAVLAGGPAAAQPILGASRDVAGLQVYPDDKDTRLFYYAPGKLTIGKDADGRPELSFLQTRYTGTTATGDRGQFRTKSILSFRVRRPAVDGNLVAAAKAKLVGERRSVRDLIPLPIRRIDTTLNYTPLTDAGEMKDTKPAGTGALEAAGDPADEGVWIERIYTLLPDDLTSQALWQALSSGKVILSLSYSYQTAGIKAGDTGAAVKGNVPGGASVPTGDKPKEGVYVALADTLVVTVDARHLPECLKKVDLNERVPANFAALSIYCYDFNNGIRPDLAEKTVEIQANSVTGKPVMLQVRFSSSTPDLYSASPHFQFAVSLKQPYRYRLREVSAEGVERVGAWRDGKAWAEMLDVTTPADQRPKLPAKPDEGDKE